MSSVVEGIALLLPDPGAYYREPDAVLRMDSETCSALYLGALDLPEALDAGRVQVAGGNAVEASKVFAFFDRFDPRANYKIPPLGS